MSEDEEQSEPDWVVRTPAEQRALDAQRPNKRRKTGGRKKGTPNKRTLEKMHAAANDAVASQDGRQFNCRKAGSLNKRTVAKLQAAEHELAAARAGKRLAIDHMDHMVEYFSNLVGVLAPWNADGTPREGRDHDLWFRTVAAFQGFLAMRAPYQTPRMSAVAIVPPAKQTMVKVTILDERGETVYSDADADADHGEPGEGATLIEGRGDDAVA